MRSPVLLNPLIATANNLVKITFVTYGLSHRIKSVLTGLNSTNVL